MRKVLVSLLFFVFVQQLLAQPDREMRSLPDRDNPSEKKEKEIKPSIGMWNLNEYAAFKDSTKLDTLHEWSHIFHPVYKKAWTATYLGNYGSPALDNNFFNRHFSSPYFFAQSREVYMLTPPELDYYNTRTPYTRLDYSQSENKSRNNETRFNVIHSQNINPWWNFTFRVNLAKSDGQYTAQATKNNSVALYSSYTKNAWSVHAGFITNSLTNAENGGLTSDSLLFEERDAEYWDVRLNSTNSAFRNSYFFGNAEYRLGKYAADSTNTEEEIFRPIVGLIYGFELNFNKHDFKEDESNDSAFWQNTYYPEDYTLDKIRFNQITNFVQLKQYENANRKYSFGKRAFAGLEVNNGSMPGIQLSDTIHQRTNISYSNAFVGGGIFKETGRFWKWNFDGRLYLTGRKIGQTEFNGLIYKPLVIFGDSAASVSFRGSLLNRVPDYFQEDFRSNHFQWDQNLKAEQRLVLGGAFKLPERSAEVGGDYAIINNFVYNNSEAIPDQTSKELLVLSAYVDKDFHFRTLHLRTRILWQKPSDETYIHLPEWSAFVSGYFQFTISKVLLAQIGSDVRYNTQYYADAYEPATGIFYLQNEKKYGNYPYIDVYANLRLKRTRVFFKYMNLGTHFLNGEYMTTPHYPMNRATFRLGVSWAFYD